MIQKKPFIKASFCCFVTLFLVISINISPIEAQSGLNPLLNLWKMGDIIPGIPLNVLEQQDVNFPPLTGPYQTVGRISFPLVYQRGNVTPDPQMNAVLDQLYTEDIYDSNYVYGGNSNEPRKFMVWVHYPATDLIPLVPAPYIPPLLANAMESEGVIVEATQFERFHPHAYENALLSDAQPFYPVLIFSHGKNMHPLFYSAMLEELASQGYIVVSIVHPHDAPASVFPPPDGDVLVTPDGTENSYVEWAVATNPEILTMYEIESRPKDALLTLISLAMMNNGFPDSMFKNHLDLTNVGMFGHSFGAGTSAWVSQLLSQFSLPLVFKATLFLDVTAVPLVLQDGTPPLSQPVMFMNGSGAEYDGNSPLIAPGDEETVKDGSTMNAYYLMQTFPFYFFELETSTHQTYVPDIVLAAPYLVNFDPYVGVPIVGIDNERAVNIINTYMVAFFNKHLKNTEEPLLDEPSCDYPEVCFRNQPLTIPPCSWLYSSSPPITPTPDPGVVPEPGTIVLFGVGLLGLLALLRRKRQR